MVSILNIAGTFLGARPLASVDPPEIVTPLDTSTLAPTIDYSRWGADPDDSSVRYTVTATFGGTPFSLTGATNIDGTSYTIAPAFTTGVEYEITVTATISGVAQVTSAPVAFIKSVASLGLIQSSTMKYSQMRTATNQLYLQYTALPPAYTSLAIVNPAAGTYGVVTGMRGQPAPRLLISHPDGYDYMGTYDAKNELWKIDPVARTGVRVVDAAPGVRAFRRLVVAPHATPANGLIWCGSDTKAFLSKYDPVTQAFFSYPTLQAGRGYVYFLMIEGSDPATYNVIGVLSYEPWVLVVFNPRTEVATLYHTADGDKGGQLYRRNSDGVVLYRRQLAAGGGAIQWESIIGGVVSSIAAQPDGTYTHTDQINYGFDANPANWLYDVNLAPASTTNFTPAVVEYKLKTSPTWLDIDIDGITTSDVEPYRVRPFDSDTFAIIGSEFVPPYHWTPSTDTLEIGGFASASWYAVCVDGTDEYYAGYDNRFFRRDTTLPWTLYPGHPDPTTTNPRKLPSSGQWHYFLEMEGSGSTRRLWSAAKSSRDATGVFLNRYTPATDVLTVFNVAPTSTVVTGLVVSATEGIIVALTESGAGKVKVINPATGALVREYTTANADPGFLVKLSDSEMLCIEDYRYSKLNITTGTVSYPTTTVSKLFGTHNYVNERWAELHGSEVRLQVGNVMNSLNVTTGVLTPITGGASTPKQVSWLGSTAYAWNINGFEVNP